MCYKSGCTDDQQKIDFITTFALDFGKQVAMTDARIGGRLLPPLFPLAHEARGWGRGNTATR